MSIYATLWALKFPIHGDFHTGCDWTMVFAQGVPAHIGADDDSHYAQFLPPIAGSVSGDLRAVVFVKEDSMKGTDRSGQEYVDPLLILTGIGYTSTPFPVLHSRLCDALRGHWPRFDGEATQPDGSVRVFFDDGSSIHVPAHKPADG